MGENAPELGREDQVQNSHFPAAGSLPPYTTVDPGILTRNPRQVSDGHEEFALGQATIEQPQDVIGDGYYRPSQVAPGTISRGQHSSVDTAVGHHVHVGHDQPLLQSVAVEEGYESQAQCFPEQLFDAGLNLSTSSEARRSEDYSLPGDLLSGKYLETTSNDLFGPISSFDTNTNASQETDGHL